MKLFIQHEPNLGRALRPKRQRRMSYKWLKKLRNRAVRRELKNNFEVGIEILKRKRDYEY